MFLWRILFKIKGSPDRQWEPLCYGQTMRPLEFTDEAVARIEYGIAIDTHNYLTEDAKKSSWLAGPPARSFRLVKIPMEIVEENN